MDHHPLGFPGPLESSITPDQRISADVFRNFNQISPFFPNLMGNPMYDLPTKPQSVYFKTRMCVKFISGCCPKAGNCNFAHSIEELRRPPGNVDRRAFFPPEDRSSRNEQNPIISGELFDLREEQKLHKKVCWKFYNGEFCPYGDKCSFSHVVPGSLPDSPLFNQKSLCWKTKICHKWSTSGNCSYGDQCSYAHGDAGVAPIEAKIRENRIRWFGHIFHRPIDAVVKRSDRIIIKDHTRGRGRPKLILEVVIQKDMRVLNITERDAFDRALWKSWIHVSDPN